MLDGRIDAQGTVAELRARGVLDEIAHAEEVVAYEDGQRVATESPTAEEIAAAAVDGTSPTKETKKPRKLIKDEERQEGGVKWSIYKTYLKASYVWFVAGLITYSQSGPQLLLDMDYSRHFHYPGSGRASLLEFSVD